MPPKGQNKNQRFENRKARLQQEVEAHKKLLETVEKLRQAKQRAIDNGLDDKEDLGIFDQMIAETNRKLGDQAENIQWDTDAMRLEHMTDGMKEKSVDPEDTDDHMRQDKVMVGLFARDMMKILYPEEPDNQNPQNAENPQNAQNPQNAGNPQNAQQAPAPRGIFDYDALDLELEAEENGNPVDPEGADKLRLILEDVDAYSVFTMSANRKEMYDSARRDPRNQENKTRIERLMQREDRLARRIYRRLTALYDEMNAQNELANQDRSEHRQVEFVDDERMYAVSSLLNYFQGNLFGTLGSVPDQPGHLDEIHVRDEGSYMRLEGAERDAGTKVQEGHANPQELVLEHDNRSKPLFPHTPSPMDVEQCYIGDCYLMSVLTELAAKHPEKIREMMHDNGDGTVNVRLYHRVKNGNSEDSFEPFQVTVEKIATDGQAQSSVWVPCLERALAVSGMGAYYQRQAELNHNPGNTTDKDISPQPVPENIATQYQNAANMRLTNHDTLPWITDIEGNVKPWQPHLADIGGGMTSYAMELLLGNDVQQTILVLEKGRNPRREDIKPIPLEKGYSSSELETINRLEKALQSGSVVTASTRDAHRREAQPLFGIEKSHSYALLGIVKKEIDGHTHYFAKLRDPHGIETRGLERNYYVAEENGRRKLVATDRGNANNIFRKTSGDGICYMEFHHFVREMSYCSIGAVKESRAERNAHIAAEESRVLKSYKEAFRDIRNYLGEHVHFYNSTSNEYDAMAKAVKELADDGASSYKDLTEKMEDLLEKVDAYQFHCLEVAGNQRRRNKVSDAVRTIRELSVAMDRGFVHPKAHLKEMIALGVIETYKKKLQDKPEEQRTPQEQSVLKLMEDDRREAVRGLINSKYFHKQALSTNTVVKMTEMFYSQVNVASIRPEMIDHRLEQRQMKTYQDVLNDRAPQGPAAH